MKYPLDGYKPPPPDMPEEVTLRHWQQGTPDVFVEQWYLAGNEDDTWTLSQVTHRHLSDLLLWLYENGYKPIGGTNPTEFQRQH
jgi:hypothetical protein